MRPHGIVVPPPTLDDDLGFGARAEPFEAETFVAEFAVEAFADAILPGLAGLDQRGADALRSDPGQELLGNELRTVVAAQEDRRTALADQARQHLDYPRRANAAVYVDRQTLLGELVGDGQALELLAVGAAVEYEVVGPHLVRRRWRLWPRPARSHALSRTPAWHLQTRSLPQPVSSPWAHLISVPSKKDANAPIAKARILRRQRLHSLDYWRIPRRLLALIVQRRSRHRK